MGYVCVFEHTASPFCALISPSVKWGNSGPYLTGLIQRLNVKDSVTLAGEKSV